MNKFFIVLSILIVVIFGSILFYHTNTNWQTFRCSSHLIMRIISKEDTKLELNIDTNFITTNESGGEFRIVGSLKEENNNYFIHRRVFITMVQSDFKNFFKTVITREIKSPIDNTPDQLWQQYILPEVPNTEFYMEMRKLNDNSYLIKGIASPHFICVVEQS